MVQFVLQFSSFDCHSEKLKLLRRELCVNLDISREKGPIDGLINVLSTEIQYNVRLITEGSMNN